MSKLTTKDIKQMIGVWLSTPEATQKLSYNRHYGQIDQDTISELASDFGVKTTVSPEEFNKAFLKEFQNPNKWSRCSKEKVDMTARDFEWMIDVVGFVDDEVNNLTESQLKGCINRTFSPKNDRLADNFRLEVYSNPQDDKVIAWTVIVD